MDDVTIEMTLSRPVYEKLTRLAGDDPWDRTPGEIVVEDFLVPYLAEIELPSEESQVDPLESGKMDDGNAQESTEGGTRS